MKWFPDRIGNECKFQSIHVVQGGYRRLVKLARDA